MDICPRGCISSDALQNVIRQSTNKFSAFDSYPNMVTSSVGTPSNNTTVILVSITSSVVVMTILGIIAYFYWTEISVFLGISKKATNDESS